MTETIEVPRERFEKLEETVEQQADRIDELEDELSRHKDHVGREHADIRSRVTEVEEETGPEPENPGLEAEEAGSTPLERICALPEHVSGRELTANQERARFVAMNVRDYAEKAPAGLVIDSSTVKKVITAAEGKRPHTQTVSRVMEFMNEFGKDAVQLKKRRGKNLVVIEPEAADRYHSRCDGAVDGTGPKSVMGPA